MDAHHAKSYEGFFGFSEAPFSLAPNTRFRFESASHAAALAELGYALERHEPLVVVTGDIGMGKTLLCRTVLERLERRTFFSVINDPRLERDDLLKRMLEDYGVISKDRTKLTPTTRHDLVHALQEFLSTLVPLQAHAVLIIDEAQHLQPDVIEEIRLVSNIHGGRGTMLQVVLVGQTDLEPLLSRPELRQVKQRVTRHFQLDPLTPAEVAQYIEHRLAVARGTPTPSRIPGAKELQHALADWEAAPRATFAPEAVAAVAEISGGVPRVINLLCDRALEAAYAEQVRTVSVSSIHTAARALDLPVVGAAPLGPIDESAEADPLPSWTLEETAARPRQTRRVILAAALAAAALVIWFGGRTMSLFRSGGSPPEAASGPREAEPADTPVAQAAAPEPPVAPQPAGIAATPAPSPQAPVAPAAGIPAGAAPTPAPQAAAPGIPAGATGAAVGANSGGFEIVVASFKTATRANAVAAAVGALGQPVRQRVSAGWQQVLAGPYPSRAQAAAAQAGLDRAGFTGTQIVPVER